MQRYHIGPQKALERLIEVPLRVDVGFRNENGFKKQCKLSVCVHV
jgi:hypothetical protein